MKLRFRGNSLRLRVNQREVSALAAGDAIEERVDFASGTAFVYRLQPSAGDFRAELNGGVIRVSVPAMVLRNWRESDEIGLYQQDGPLAIAIEKDLECKDGPPEEFDPFAYPREKAC